MKSVAKQILLASLFLATVFGLGITSGCGGKEEKTKKPTVKEKPGGPEIDISLPGEESSTATEKSNAEKSDADKTSADKGEPGKDKSGKESGEK